EFGTGFMGEIATYLQSNARQIFADDTAVEPPARPARGGLSETVRETLHFFRQGKSVEDVAQVRGLKLNTVYSHLEEALRGGERMELDRLIDPKAQQEIAAAFGQYGYW